MPLNSRGIGERALERVVLRLERAAKLGEIGLEHLQSAALELRQRVLAATQVDGRPPLGPGLGKTEAAHRKLERRQAKLARRLAYPEDASAAGRQSSGG